MPDNQCCLGAHFDGKSPTAAAPYLEAFDTGSGPMGEADFEEAPPAIPKSPPRIET